MITCQQVEDLRDGDVVELTFSRYPDVTIRGPLHEDVHGGLRCGPDVVRNSDGTPPTERGTLTVVSRAPRPLYVNHPRPAPVAGDVVRNADDATSTAVYLYAPCDFVGDRPWVPSPQDQEANLFQVDLPARLRLLVDGETGQVVQ